MQHKNDAKTVITDHECEHLLQQEQPEGWPELVAIARASICKDLAGCSLPPAEEILCDAREERDARFLVYIDPERSPDEFLRTCSWPPGPCA